MMNEMIKVLASAIVCGGSGELILYLPRYSEECSAKSTDDGEEAEGDGVGRVARAGGGRRGGGGGGGGGSRRRGGAADWRVSERRGK